jgi:hypothetical protein
MSHSIYSASVESFIAALGSLNEILALAGKHEDAASLPAARLAPDMFPLSTQVQMVCFHATTGAARLAGREAAGRPAMQETDLAGLQAIVADTVQTLRAFTPADFAGAEERRIIVNLQPPTVLDIDGTNYLNRWLLPNFYFHQVTAYDILRHNGLPLGKKDFLSHLAGFMRQNA